jgi:hypothetical protein
MAVMDWGMLSLVDEARNAGLRVELAGGRLRIRGPKRAAPLAHALLSHREAIVALLRPTYMYPWPEVLPDLSRRIVDFIAWCLDCRQRSTFVRYSGRPLCLPCALKRTEAANLCAPPEAVL